MSDIRMKCICGTCKICKRRNSQRRYREEHPEFVHRCIEKLIEAKDRIHRKQVCNILKKHAEDLKDDPERLSTEFLQDLIGIECRKVL